MRLFFTLLFVLSFVSFLNASGIEPANQPVDSNKATNAIKSEKIYKNQSILATGKWVRLSAIKSGIQKISYSRLSELGISNPSGVAVYSNGGFMLPKMNAVDYPDDLTQLPVLHAKDKNGSNCIFFYSPGTTSWQYESASEQFVHTTNLYTDSTFFYLSSDVAASAEPSPAALITETPETTLTTYVALEVYEKEKLSLVNSGRVWYSDRLMPQLRKSYTFNFPNAIGTADAKISMTSVARCTETEPSLTVKLNSSITYKLEYWKSSKSEEPAWGQIRQSTWSLPANENMTVDLTYNTNGFDGEAYIDYIALNVPSTLHFNGSQVDFRSVDALKFSTLKYNVAETNANCLVWNLNNPLKPKLVPVTFNAASKEISFLAKGGGIDEYIVFDPANGTFSEPQFSSSIKNQNIHGMTSYEMIIVTHPDFINESTTLAEFHRQNDNMSVLVVTTNEVYNEFSSGMPDISGIRNMFRMFYSKGRNSATPFRYALLMGDGSFNNRKTNDIKNDNFIPTYQSLKSESNYDSYVTDDFYGLLDEDEGESEGDLDIGIGRIPCKTASEAETVVTKTIEYTKPKTMGEWRNVVCFLADDQDLNDYMEKSDELDLLLQKNYPGFYTKKIYLDAYQQLTTSGGPRYPDVNLAINESVNEGALIFNYIGHGNPQSMAHENVLQINDIKSWKNNAMLPLFVTATCEFGHFDGEAVSAAEEILLNPTGGGIALFTTTRPVYAANNQVLSISFYSNIFKHDESGEKLRLGEVMRRAKNATNDENKLSFTLLADPALRLAFPKYSVRTKSINDVDISTTDLTLGALEKVTIKGEVVDYTGAALTGYSGNIITAIYDKVDTVETLANDGGVPYRFPIQNNLIYRGVSSVVNGEFELSFIVPKDISYNIGSGRIIYYTSDGENDGNGAISTFKIGGSGNSPIIENNAPEIALFMNNEDFKSYGTVSSSALLLVNLFDESGINTVGTGIGHDLIAVIDDDFSNPILLNNFYSSVANSYQNGKIIYPLTDLEPGEHKIWVRVWDVQNNSSEKEIYFVVEDGFKVTSVNNIPNPVSVYTDFEISHNLPGDVFDVTIDIYNLSGQRINTLTETVSSSKTTTIKVRWNVFQTNQPVYPNQWLVFRTTLKNQSGLTAFGAGKILISSKN
jgi:hypothetical protein